MNVTVRIAEEPAVSVTAESFECRPPDRVDFSVDGQLRVSEGRLGAFAGRSLRPARLALSVDGGDSIEVDLDDAAALELETVDVGVATPDTDDLPIGEDRVPDPSGAIGSSGDTEVGAIAFTVAGTIVGIPEDVTERLSGGTPAFESITFALKEGVRSDGGADDVLLSVTLFGFAVVVRRDGTIEIGTADGGSGSGLL